MKITKMSRVVFPKQANQRGALFGGELMAWMDEVAGVTARRFAGCDIVTAAVEKIQFYRPIPVGSFVDVTGEVVHVGHTSMRIRVAATMEDPDGGEEETRMADAVFIYVAVDEEGRPRTVGRTLEKA